MRALFVSAVLVLAPVLLGACASPRVAVPQAERLSKPARDDYRAALAAWGAGEHAAALDALAELRALEPWHVPSHVLWQDASVAAGRSGEVRAWYRTEARARPDDAARVLLDGRLTPRDGGAREQAYRRAVELDPDSPWPTLALSYELNRSALDAFERSVALADQGYAEDAAAQRALAARLHDESRGLADALVERFPDLPSASAGAAEVLLTRGSALGERGTLQRALDLAERAAELDPANPSRHALVARVHRELIDDSAAEAALRRALELDAGDPDLLASLGRVLLDLGRPDEARDTLRAALRASPGDAVVTADLGVAEHRVGRLDRARLHLREAAALAEADPRPLEALALVEIERGDRAAARRALRRYLERGGEDRAWAERTIAELSAEE